MSHEVRMPSLGMAMDEGQVVKWHVKPGDAVSVGQTILEIESEKTTAEIDAPVAGVIGNILVDVGSTVPVDTILVRIGNDLADATKANDPVVAKPRVSANPTPPNAQTVAHTVSGRSGASPRARKLAESLGVNLSKLTGTGPGGSIVEADIHAAAEDGGTKSITADDYVLRTLSPIRRRIADRTAESARTAPHFFVSNDIDASALAECQSALKLSGGASRPTLNDIILWAVAQTLPNHPLLNSAYFDDGLHEWKDINLGVVAAVDEGLMVPVVRKANMLSFNALVQARTDLIERARKNQLQPDDMLGGTFSVSNLGSFGVERFNSILNRGQSGILSVGALTKRPALIDDKVGIGAFVSLTLTVDHRCVDGVAAARFLGDLGERLESIAIGDLRALNENSAG